MTVQTTKSSILHVAQSTQVDYPFDFLVLSESHLFVYVNGLPYLNGFSVTGVGNPSGGVITLDSNLPGSSDGLGLLVDRQVPATQETDYISYDGFSAESHESALDKLTMLVQQNTTLHQRSLRVSSGDPVNEAGLIIPTDRAGKVISFNEDGEIVLVDFENGGGAGETINETKLLVDGQTNVVFDTVDTSIASFFLVSQNDDQGRLHEVTDYELNVDGVSIDLTDSYPTGSKIFAEHPDESFSSSSSGVETFEGRTGHVVALLGDYTADEILYDNSSTGILASTEQEAIDEIHGLSVASKPVSEVNLGSFGTSSTQEPTGLGDANKITVNFGPGGNTTGGEFTVAANGEVTCNTNSIQYKFDATFRLARNGAAGVSELILRIMYAANGVDFIQVGSTLGVKIDDADTVWREEAFLSFSPAVGSVLKIELARNNGSANEGGIGTYTLNGDLSSWAPLNSAQLTIFKIVAE